MSTAERLAAWSGVAGALIGFATILAATALSPTFSWAGNALSDLGAPGAANPWLFNWGLVASGVVALPFGLAVWDGAEHALQRVGAVVAALGFACLALVGLYPSGTDLHTPAAVAYFTLFTFAMWLHGSGTVLAGRPRRGLASVWLGIVHVLSWAIWAAGVRVGDGLAIPEFVGSVLFFAWVVATTASLDAVDFELR